MIMLSWLGLLESLDTFSGFASNVVIAVIGVMIIFIVIAVGFIYLFICDSL